MFIPIKNYIGDNDTNDGSEYVYIVDKKNGIITNVQRMEPVRYVPLQKI